MIGRAIGRVFENLARTSRSGRFRWPELLRYAVRHARLVGRLAGPRLRRVRVRQRIGSTSNSSCAYWRARLPNSAHSSGLDRSCVSTWASAGTFLGSTLTTHSLGSSGEESGVAHDHSLPESGDYVQFQFRWQSGVLSRRAEQQHGKFRLAGRWIGDRALTRDSGARLTSTSGLVNPANLYAPPNSRVRLLGYDGTH